MHLWWARRPLAACRAVLFAQLVDDPSSHPDRFPTEEDQAVERKRLFDIIERLVVWQKHSRRSAAARGAPGDRRVLRWHAAGDPRPVRGRHRAGPANRRSSPVPPSHDGEIHRVTLVGTHLVPGKPTVKDDGTEVRTLWGELAWQLGGRPAFEVIAEADRTATNRGLRSRR